MKCTEPPMRWPRSPERPKHSAMTPWPANEASPDISSGMAQVRSSGVAPSWSCLARVLPSTTGLTISRCDGLAVSERWTRLLSNSRSDDAPRWYLTSPEPSASSGEAEPLGSRELQVAELLEAFRLDQLVEDRPLALAGEADLLVEAFDAFLDPAFLLRVGDVHELDPQRLAIGTLEDGQDLPQGSEFEPEHVVEEDRTVEIGVGEAVAAGIELFRVLAGLE